MLTSQSALSISRQHHKTDDNNDAVSFDKARARATAVENALAAALFASSSGLTCGSPCEHDVLLDRLLCDCEIEDAASRDTSAIRGGYGLG